MLVLQDGGVLQPPCWGLEGDGESPSSSLILPVRS